jgi:MFS transporter, FLVCR family, MFS-domain-containing protein 7
MPEGASSASSSKPLLENDSDSDGDGDGDGDNDKETEQSEANSTMNPKNPEATGQAVGLSDQKTSDRATRPTRTQSDETSGPPDSIQYQPQSIPESSQRDYVLGAPQGGQPYKTYKRRFWGLAQLVLLNIIVSWDWLTFAAVSTTSAHYFNVSESAINWLSTGFLFAFVPLAPLVIWTLKRGGPKWSICVSSALVLAGNWVRYGGTRAGPDGDFGAVVFGQILIGFSQPFVLAAPTRYSNLWFSDRGRVTATALATLANPLGAALGQLIGPFWASTSKNAGGIPDLVLYTSLLSTVATLPSPFLPRGPPTPPSATAANEHLSLSQAWKALPKNGSFWLIFFPFSVYVGFFNAVSTLINQFLYPYGFSETDAGIAGAVLIFVGLGASAVVSPIVDRTKAYLLTIKVLVPMIAVSYLILIFMPGTRTVAGPYVIFAFLGATSFSLLPCTLEYLVIVTHPVSPEITSTIAWTGGQVLGGIFIVIMNALKGGLSGEPDGNMKRALVFVAVISWVAAPCVFWLGTGRFRMDGQAQQQGVTI